MGMGFAPTWLRQVSPPASQNHFNHCPRIWLIDLTPYKMYALKRAVINAGADARA